MKLSKDDDFYSRVMRRITKVRDQGEPPRSDVFALDTYVCDLCKGSISKENITQCPFCGRWVCKKNCWDTNHMACTTCIGVIKLCRESIEIENKQKKMIINNKIVTKKSSTKKKDSKHKSILEKLVKKKIKFQDK